jgi:TolB-like protein/DNA-binding winged helix-turn-helix (wHTH) protein/Flp pilus assembly protein TadD
MGTRFGVSSCAVSTSKRVDRAVLLYRFGAYEVDTTRNELRKSGARIRLEPKPWLLLVALLERAGNVVTRSDLQQVLWGADLFVEFDKGLNVAVAKVRAALSDLPEKPRYIETVPGQGYRFAADVERIFGPSLASSAEALRHAQLPAPSSEDYPSQPDPALQGFISAGIRRPWLRRRGGAFVVAVTVCMVLLAVTVTKLTLRRPRAQGWVHDEKIMLVVLPFENLSGDPGQEYLSDGITEELSEKLGNQDPPQLGVIGRTSAMTYKYSHRTIREIGKELGVDYVLEGSVRRNGSEVRVMAQLVQVSDQAHVWAASYDENLGDLLKLERELASEIARQVGMSIAIGQTKKPVQLHDPTPEAHEAYLLGRYHWYKRTTEGWKTAEEYFRLAIQKDPNYAAAYAALAECRIPRDEAHAAALKAIALDPNSGEAYTALGWVEVYRYLDRAAAAPAFRQAIELAPNYAQAHYSYAETLHPHDAIKEVREAISLDPLSPLFHSGLANVLLDAGQFDDAVRELRIVLELDPKFAVGHGGLGVIYTQEGRYKEAIQEFQIEQKLGGNYQLGRIGYAYAHLGNKKQTLRILSQLEAQEDETGGVSYDLAMVELGLGNKDKAIAWLQKLNEDHDDDNLLWLANDHVFDPLHTDPRFQDIVRRMSFPL